MPNEELTAEEVDKAITAATIAKNIPKEKSVLSEEEQDYEDKLLKYDDSPEKEL